MKLKTLQISQITPYWRNIRKNEQTIELTMQSIQEYGYNVPITVDKKNVIITGHARFEALKRLGWKKVPVIVLDFMDDKTAREYRIDDNTIGEKSIWDNEKLQMEIRDIKSETLHLYFPEIDTSVFERVSFKQTPITQESIEKNYTEMSHRFLDRQEIQQERKFEIKCPKCGKIFFINKDDSGIIR